MSLHHAGAHTITPDLTQCTATTDNHGRLSITTPAA